MLEIFIKKNVKSKKLKGLLNFLFSICDNIAFFSYHLYHLEEEQCNELLNEYRERCIQKHRTLKELFQNDIEFAKKTMKKNKIANEEEYIDYIDEIFQSEMSVYKQMEQTLEKLIKIEDKIDYNNIALPIGKYYKEQEVHLYDLINVSLLPLDSITYDLSEEIKDILLSKDAIKKLSFQDEKQNVLLFNPTFAIKDEIVAYIDNDSCAIIMFIKEEDYDRFKKLKIKHKKGTVEDEKGNI